MDTSNIQIPYFPIIELSAKKKKNISKIPLSFSLNTELMPSFYILFILSLSLRLTKYHALLSS